MGLKYIEIVDNGNYGNMLDAVMSNLGYCLSATNDEEFFNHIYKVGCDFSLVLLSEYSDYELTGILLKSTKRAKKDNCSSWKNDYNINICYIDKVSKMIAMLSAFSNVLHGSFLYNYFKKKYCIYFYTYYFTILKDNENYKVAPDLTLEIEAK